MIVINTHSFVDLITNSSSELFVCDTDKSLDMVKQIIEKITRNYYDEMNEECPDIWEDIFQEPTIVKKGFNLKEYPDQETLNKATNYWHEINTRVDWQIVENARQQIIEYFGIEGNEALIDYNIKIKKGNILLRSADDNSVPYEIWDRIGSILNARRYHLG